MVEECIAEGWIPYILTFEFDHIRGSEKVRLAVMRGALDRFYPIFANRTTNNSTSPSGAAKRPICLLSPDYPVRKKAKKKARLKEVIINGGLHFQGPGLLHPTSRIRHQGLVQHFIVEKSRYINPSCFPLNPVHAKPIHETSAEATTYLLKKMEEGRFTPDDMLIYPVNRSNLPPRTIAEQRHKKIP